MNVVCLIPARGGSKGIPRKNIRTMCGRPLIDYAIRAALQAASVSRVIVSTEDAEIAEIAAACGAEVPFMRPRELAEDHVLDFPVVEHCLQYLMDVEHERPDLLLFLRPTMPLRQVADIDAAVAVMAARPDVDTVRTTRPPPYPPFWMKRIDPDGCLHPFTDAVASYQHTRRQDLPPVVMCDGYVDLVRVASVLRHRQLVCGRVFALYRDGIPFADLDTPEDWDYCEYLIKKMKAP